MHTSLLSLYLHRVAKGDARYLDRLILQLSERLVFVPIATISQDQADQVKTKILIIKEAHRCLVPVFTKERFLNDWCASRGRDPLSISLLGKDLCQALSSPTWLQVNPMTAQEVELQPFLVKEMADSKVNQDEESWATPFWETEIIESDDLSLNQANFDWKPKTEQQTVPLIADSKREPQARQLIQHLPMHRAAPQEAPKKPKRSFLNFLRYS